MFVFVSLVWAGIKQLSAMVMGKGAVLLHTDGPTHSSNFWWTTVTLQ